MRARRLRGPGRGRQFGGRTESIEGQRGSSRIDNFSFYRLRIRTFEKAERFPAPSMALSLRTTRPRSFLTFKTAFHLDLPFDFPNFRASSGFDLDLVDAGGVVAGGSPENDPLAEGLDGFTSAHLKCGWSGIERRRSGGDGRERESDDAVISHVGDPESIGGIHGDAVRIEELIGAGSTDARVEPGLTEDAIGWRAARLARRVVESRNAVISKFADPKRPN